MKVNIAVFAGSIDAVAALMSTRGRNWRGSVGELYMQCKRDVYLIIKEDDAPEKPNATNLEIRTVKALIASKVKMLEKFHADRK